MKLPTGNKFYPIPEEHQKWVEQYLNGKNINTIKQVTDLQYRGDYDSRASTYNLQRIYTDIVDVVGSDYPWVKSTYSLYTLFSNTQGYHITIKADYYTSCTRNKYLNDLPYFEGKYIRWCPVRKGVIIKDVPYEGELVKTKEFTKQHKVYKDTLLDMVSAAKAAELLGDTHGDYVSTPYNREKKITLLYKSFNKMFEEGFSLDNYIPIVVSLGSYTYNYCYTSSRQGLKPYVLKPTNKKPKVPAPLKTKILFELGAYTLPDNYLEWFDG